MNPRERMIFHIDVNSAFLSWEAVYRLQHGDPIDLRSIPSVVGGDERSRHGIVLAKSTPAKKFDIHTGEVLWQARKKCPNLVVAAPDHDLYMTCSNRLMQLLSEYSPLLERYSIDECFLDMSAYKDKCNPELIGRQMADRVLEELGFTVNVGISTNKLLAKMASEFEKPNRVHTLWPEEIPSKLWTLPVRELFMVGPRTAPRLFRLNIFSVGHLAHSDPAFLEMHFKSFGRLMWQYANGIDNSPVCAEESVAKAIGNSTTTPLDVTDIPGAELVLLSLAEKASSRLRQAGLLANVVSVSLRKTDLRFCSHQRKLVSPSDNTGTLYQEAKKLLAELWSGDPIRHVGISFSDLIDDTYVQASLFDDTRMDKKKALDTSIDSIRREHGKEAVVRGCLLDNPAAMKRNRQCPPRTQSDDLPSMRSRL